MGIEEMMKDPAFKGYLNACMSESVAIEYSYSPESGTRLHIRGIIPLLFNGICTILKSIAMQESGDTEDRKFYVKMVCDQVLEELEEDGNEQT